MRTWALAGAAVVVLAGLGTAVAFDDPEPTRVVQVAADPATARPGLTPLSFTMEVFEELAGGRLDAKGRIYQAAYVGDDCTTLPVRLRRTAEGDLVLGSQNNADGSCGNAGPFVDVRITLADGPVASGTALVSEQSSDYGTLLLREDEPVPLKRPDALDCGRTTESYRTQADAAAVECLTAAVVAGRPAVLRVRSFGVDSGSDNTYEVIGPDRVRLVHDSRVTPGYSENVSVAPCQRFLGQRDGYLRTASCGLPRYDLEPL